MWNYYVLRLNYRKKQSQEPAVKKRIIDIFKKTYDFLRTLSGEIKKFTDQILFITVISYASGFFFSIS